ncbi:CoA transferase [Aestuariicella hydrocarbonica]|uniref:CoA transferase n=1 Tax=Pseudomaricurvus hydrocarbonicus TaxID=1470433 RepID=A0A9E5MQN1_9GAMM|nr:CoA transferase [Aestuariicella hydrocarbonica]NHO68543.1 CoA transferase [Aestuariicella hydrocarbonica]
MSFVDHYARSLLDSLGLAACDPVADLQSPQHLWAESGAMWLSGHPQELPRPCPAPLAACARGAWLALAALNPTAYAPHFSAHRLLGERAAISSLTRHGKTSAGGACHLLETADGSLALNLAREDDRELLTAWLQQPVDDAVSLETAVAQQQTTVLVRRARMMGLAAAPVASPKPSQHWYRATRYSSAIPNRTRPPIVVDLTSLWAGPLCASLLSLGGARVIKVESSKRPDGARLGPAQFFHLMNSGKESVALDLSTEPGRKQLRQLLSHADIVLEAARPRGLEQMGIVAKDYLSAKPGRVWLSITGYGRRSPMKDWIAYGDDAGVAAGLSWLMARDGGGPVFCGDAIADPLTGLHAALLAQASWIHGGGELLDISLYDVVSYCIGAGCVSRSVGNSNYVAEPPTARQPTLQAGPLGEDTARILKEFS